MAVRRVGGWVLAVVLLAVFGSACRDRARQYREFPLKGQVLSVGTTGSNGWRELSIKHEDIPGFMPAMSMAYYVRQPSLLDNIAPGDLVTARLILDGSEVYVDRVTKTGHAPLAEDARPVKVMDVMSPGDVVPDDVLQDQEGRARKLSDWRGRALAVTFVYTRCPVPDFCPLMDRHFGDLQEAIEADPALRGRAHLASVSFDPSHDTAAVIAAHAKGRGAHPQTWSYLTGPADAVDHFTSRFGVSTILEKDPAETITHNLRTAVIDAQGKLVKIYSGNEWSVDALLTDLRNAAR